MVTAFILATAKTGKEREVLESLKNFPEIREAFNVYGDYDLLLKAEADNMDRLNEFLVRHLRSMPNLAMTTTMIGL